MSQTAELDELLADVHAEVTVCPKCRLSRTRTIAVPGEGPVDARLMLIGEGPGRDEDLQGRPFVGAAGHLLDQILREAGIPRRQVFITNIVKCRPPGNRDPLPDEMDACLDYLMAQIAIIRPRVIGLLGRIALERMLGGGYRISRCHGQAIERGEVTYLPLYHPAAALHQESLRREMLADVPRLRAVLQQHGIV